MSAVHDYGDRLLDLAYGELLGSEAKELEAHVRGCSQCSNALDDIRGVRNVMGRLPPATEPGAGLESLMAYAEQAARRSSAGPEPKALGWRRWLAPVLGMTAVAALGAVTLTTLTANRELAPTASQVMADGFGAKKSAAVTPVSGDMAPARERATAEEGAKAEAVAVEAKTEKLSAAREERPAELQDNQDRAKNALVAEKPNAVMRNDAELDQKFASKRNLGPLDKDSNRGAPVGYDQGGGGALGGASASASAFGGEKQQQVGAGSTIGRTGEGKGSGSSYDSLTASTSTGDRRADPLMPAKKAPMREQEKAEEFAFDEAPPVADRKADVAYQYNKTRSRSDSKADDDVVAAPPAPMAVAQKELEEERAAEDAPAKVAVESSVMKKARSAEQAPADSDLLKLRMLVQQARQARVAGNRKLEAAYLRQAVVLPVRGPDHAGALIQLGEVEAALGRYDASDAALRQAMALYPSTSTSQMANRKLNENQQKQTGYPYAPGQHRPADLPKEAPEKRAIDAAEH